MGRIQDLIHKVGRGKEGAEPLTLEEAHEMGRLLLEGRLTPLQEGAFLMALRIKSEEPAEIAGIARALRETGGRLRTSEDALEIPSYAGKQDSLNVLPSAALIARACGVPVVVHGRKENPARVGSEEVFEALGIPSGLGLDELSARFERSRFCVLGVQAFHPALARLLAYKGEMGVRSTFFVVSRLAGPTGSRRALLPVTHKPYLAKYEEALKLLEFDRGIIFFSNEGEAELPYHGALTGVEVRGSSSRPLSVKPVDLGMGRISMDDALRLRDPAGAAEANKAILADRPSSARNLACLTAATYLYLYGAAGELGQAARLASDALSSGRALEALSVVQASFA